jgi:hypothetical protein
MQWAGPGPEPDFAKYGAAVQKDNFIRLQSQNLTI